MTRISEVVSAAHWASQTSACATQPTVNFLVGEPAGRRPTASGPLTLMERKTNRGDR